MAKIQCPHCKAVNQDVSMDDPCWQCGTILGAPPSALETGDGPPTSEANPANQTGSSSPPIQKQIERNQPRDGVPQSERPRTSSLNVGAIAIGALILALIIILAIVFLKMRH
jgi:hypothetical protein